MAPNNNEIIHNNKKQKRVQDSVADDAMLLLSFWNVLQHFPDLLTRVLPFIADRTIFNAIASSNRDIYKKSRVILPPWPMHYKLSQVVTPPVSWSPCGTLIASSMYGTSIAIVDQRCGPLRNRNNNTIGWLAHEYPHEAPNGTVALTGLEFSPNGRILFSAGYDGFVRLWNNDTGNYEQLQEWNIQEEETALQRRNSNYSLAIAISVSFCSKYVLAARGNCFFLKDVGSGNTIKSLMFPFYHSIKQCKFSIDGRAIFIRLQETIGIMVIKVWHPYLDDDNDDSLITLWRQRGPVDSIGEFALSYDNTMIAISNIHKNEITVWSIDDKCNCLTQKSSFPSTAKQPHFTFDDQFIGLYNCKGEQRFWSIADAKFTTTAECSYHLGNFINNRLLVNISPNHRQLITWDCVHDSVYITPVVETTSSISIAALHHYSILLKQTQTKN